MSAFITLTGSYMTSDPSAGRWKNLQEEERLGSPVRQTNRSCTRHLPRHRTSTDGRRATGYLGQVWPTLRRTWTSGRRARGWSTPGPPATQKRHRKSPPPGYKSAGCQKWITPQSLRGKSYTNELHVVLWSTTAARHCEANAFTRKALMLLMAHSLLSRVQK